MTPTEQPSHEPGIDRSPVPDYSSALRLDGRTIAVVGAGNGIGRQCAHAVRALGGAPVCIDVDRDRAHAVAQEVHGEPCVADVCTSSGVQVVADVQQTVGEFDGVIDIVGQARWAQLTNTTDDDFDWAIDRNVRHAYLLLRQLGAAMGDGGGGSFVFVASVSGFVSAPWHATYGMAKAGLLSLVRSAAVELGPRGVRVNAVSPGTTATPRMLASTPIESVDWPQPLGGPADPSDIASAALFLLSDMARNVTGHNLVVDGGVTCRYPIPLPIDDEGAAP